MLKLCVKVVEAGRISFAKVRGLYTPSNNWSQNIIARTIFVPNLNTQLKHLITPATQPITPVDYGFSPIYTGPIITTNYIKD
jgi:hypothetical protein